MTSYPAPKMTGEAMAKKFVYVFVWTSGDVCEIFLTWNFGNQYDVEISIFSTKFNNIYSVWNLFLLLTSLSYKNLYKAGLKITYINVVSSSYADILRKLIYKNKISLTKI